MIVLTEAELKELTDKDRSPAQARELDHMGIPYRTRRDGSLAVLRIHVETINGRPVEDRLPEPRLTLDA